MTDSSDCSQTQLVRTAEVPEWHSIGLYPSAIGNRHRDGGNRMLQLAFLRSTVSGTILLEMTMATLAGMLLTTSGREISNRENNGKIIVIWQLNYVKMW